MLKIRSQLKVTFQKRIDLGRLPQTKLLLSPAHVWPLFICLFLIFITFAAFWQVRNSEFINLDDDLYVTDNPHVQEGLTSKGALWAFTKIYAGHWHPMTWLSHMLDVNLWGLNPGGYHMINLLFHVGNTVFLFLLLLRMTGAPWRSGLVGALFALHPLHVESVAWVAERKDVLSAFFWILAMWAYVRYVERPGLNRYLLVALCFVLALMSKPMAVTLPFVLLLLDYWPLGRLKSEKLMNCCQRKALLRLILEKAPFFLLAAGFCLFTIFSHLSGGAVASFDKLPLEIRIGNALVSYITYISKMIWPVRLAVLYPHPINLQIWKVVAATLLLMIITLLVILVRRKHPYAVVGWLWYLGTLVPVIGLVQAGPQAMADRFTYMPLTGLFIMVAYGAPDILAGWRHKRVTLVASGGLLLSIYTVVTVFQVERWQNSVSLFTHTLQVSANNYIIHNNLGVTLMRQGKDQEAAVHFLKALEINPKYADAHYNLGAMLARQGKNQEATAHFLEVLRIKPSRAEAHNNLGVILAKQGRTQEAMAHFTQALRTNPNYAEAYLNLGIALVNQGRNQEAILYFQEALRMNPKDTKVHNNLGVALARQGEIREAFDHYTQALELNRSDADAHYNLGSLLDFQGRHQEAMNQYTEVLMINPLDAEAHYQLGAILARQGENQKAIVHLAEAVRIIPSHGEAHLTLGMTYLGMGKKDLAFAEYKILQTINPNLAKTLYQKISKNSTK
jgi:tetratricopeptide (TPR) repeat protein